MRSSNLIILFAIYLIIACIFALTLQFGTQTSTVVNDYTTNALERKTTYASKIHPLIPPHIQRLAMISIEQPNEIYLEKNFIYSKGRRNVDFVIGLPTVLRSNNVSYLATTISSLVEKMSKKELRSNLIVICIGETRKQRVDYITDRVKDNFSALMETGLIDIIAPAKGYYKDLYYLQQTLNDSRRRVYWRSKQNLDYIFLMSYALNRGKFYLQLEDDIIAYKDYLSFIRKFMVMHDIFRLPEQRPWLVCSFSELGCIGKVFAMKDLQGFVRFVKIFYNDQPIDWLMLAYAQLKACPWKGLSKELCEKEVDKIWIRSLQSQFQHIGNKSSLARKQQHIIDKHYGRQYWPHPKLSHLKLPWSLIHAHSKYMSWTKHYPDFEVQKEESFFWGYMPKSNGIVDHLFKTNMGKNEYRIRKGNGKIENVNFHDVIVELLPQKEAKEIRRNQTLKLDGNVADAKESEGFFIAIKFLKDGDEYLRALKRGFYVYDDCHGSSWLRNFYSSCFGFTRRPNLMIILMKTLIFLLVFR